MKKPGWQHSTRTNNPTLDWCVGVQRVTFEEAVRLNAVVDGKKGEDFLILVNDSVNPQARPHAYTQHEWAAFLLGVKDGEFDHMVDLAVFEEVNAAQPVAV